MNALVLSTGLHYLALIPHTNLSYRLTIGISTSLSAIWHVYGEPDGPLFYLDYLFAFLWLLQDLKLSKWSFEYTVKCRSQEPPCGGVRIAYSQIDGTPSQRSITKSQIRGIFDLAPCGIAANALIFIININIPYDKDYIVNHSLWHCLSALKCIYLADRISRTNNTPSRHLEQC